MKEIIARMIEVELPLVPVTVQLGTTKTGAWRFRKPVWHAERCIPCNICYKFCPEGVILVSKEGGVQLDYDYCKGCGICSNECPRKAIEMVPEL
jgi:2-oxoacid:acceptor oxidoreductase delta subunit (pyruvate/2-ketoisovalerate family)